MGRVTPGRAKRPPWSPPMIYISTPPALTKPSSGRLVTLISLSADSGVYLIRFRCLPNDWEGFCLPIDWEGLRVGQRRVVILIGRIAANCHRQ
jgi:hypothetical protein